MKILAVEDDQQFLDCLRQELAQRLPNAELDIATTLSAVEKANFEAYDVVLLDYWGPGGQSYHHLVDIEQYAEVIIAISTVANKNQLAVGRGARMVAGKIAGNSQLSAERVVDTVVEFST